jgi:hypothetical protein
MSDRHHLQTGYTLRVRGSGRIAVGILMLGLWLGLLGVSASDQLHHLLHSDSHQHHHECLVTSISKGHLLFTPMLVAAPVAVFLSFGLLLLTGGVAFRSVDIRLAPARAPPVGFLLR